MLRKIFTILFLLSGHYIFIHAANATMPEADSGIINVSNWDFADENTLLNGEWEFYWDTLINPIAFDTLNFRKLRTYVQIPSAWSSKKSGTHPIKGKGTYRLKIKTDGLEGTYGIRLYDFFTASKVWFDGKLIYEAGKPGYGKSTSVPKFKYADIPLFLSKDKTEHVLVAQVSNFHHNRSGITKPVWFGKYDILAKESRSWLITILIIVGVLLFISVNHLLNYFLYKK